MFSNLMRLVGMISVKETNTHIIIEGLDGYAIGHDIAEYWGTSRINSNMFSLIAKSKIIFPKFFAIDVLYMFEAVTQAKRTRYPKRSYRKLCEELKAGTWLSTVGGTPVQSRLNFAKVDEISFKLLPHQMEFLENYNNVVPTYRLNGMMLAAAPGSGKTITGLALASCLESDLVIIISPKNAVERVWAATLRDNMTKKPEYWHSALPQNTPPTGLRYYVFHYEALDRAIALVKQSRFSNPLIILDESHNFNEISSLRTQLFIELCKLTKVKDIIWSSGTPIKAIGFEAIPFLKTIDPFFTDDAEARFRKIFGKDAKRANDILRNRIGLVSFKVEKKEIVKNALEEREVKIRIPKGDEYTLEAIREEMSAFIEQRRKFYNDNMREYVELYDKCLDIHKSWVSAASEEDEFRKYKECVKVIRAGYDPKFHKEEAQYCNKYELGKIMPSLPDNLRKPFKNVRSIIKYVDLKILGEALGTILGKRRSKCHLEMIPYMGLPEIVDNSIKKTIIFSSYVEVVDEMSRYLSGEGYKPLVVHGATNKDLARIIEKFDKDPDANPLIATYQSLSTAVPLVMANTVVLSNAPFRDHEKDQSVSRANRLGQTETVYVVNIFLDTGDKGNISTRSKDILEWSAAQVSAIMGIEAPADLGASLESMMESTTSLEDSATRFIAYIRANLPVDCVS